MDEIRLLCRAIDQKSKYLILKIICMDFSRLHHCNKEMTYNAYEAHRIRLVVVEVYYKLHIISSILGGCAKAVTL